MADEKKQSPGRVDRRAVLRGAVYLVGGAPALAQLSACGSGSEVETAAAPALGAPGRFFDAEHMTLLREVVDTIIPETDTPGAAGVGAHGFIDAMMVDWASAETQAQITGVLDAIEARAQAEHAAGFATLAPERKLAVMRAYDVEHIHAEDRSYARFKELTLLGYYHSEIGATQELRYELVPGDWRACIPFAEIGRAWAV